MGNTYKKKAKAKATKITKEELQTMQDYVQAINRAQLDVGNLEYQKSTLIFKMGSLQDKLTGYNMDLQKKYGDVSVNIQDGSIKYKEDATVN
tara:strand:+ start:2330 stop:2605 length:276 start_codon:yes stop_codon:yes gene_type:complete